jgi:hypothetical protein
MASQLSMREQVADRFGEDVAFFLGPFPDEVGWARSAVLFCTKFFLCAASFWALVDLILPKTLGDALAGNLVLLGIAVIVVSWLSRDE